MKLLDDPRAGPVPGARAAPRRASGCGRGSRCTSTTTAAATPPRPPNTPPTLRPAGRQDSGAVDGARLPRPRRGPGRGGGSGAAVPGDDGAGRGVVAVGGRRRRPVGRHPDRVAPVHRARGVHGPAELVRVRVHHRPGRFRARPQRLRQVHVRAPPGVGHRRPGGDEPDPRGRETRLPGAGGATRRRRSSTSATGTGGSTRSPVGCWGRSSPACRGICARAWSRNCAGGRSTPCAG